MSKLNTNVATPLVLNNGMYLQTTEYNHKGGHLDKSHLAAQGEGRAYMTDLGVIEPWVTSGYLSNPYMWGFGNLKTQYKKVPGGKYKWSFPIHQEPCKILEILTDSPYPGRGGEKVRLRVNNPKYDNGWIITADPHLPFQMLITEDEIEYEIDSAIITVTYLGPDANTKWIPRDIICPGTTLIPISTVETEYSQHEPGIPGFTAGVREFWNKVGDSRSAIHYEITRDAAYKHVSNKFLSSLDAHREVIEMYKFKPNSLGHDMSLKGQSPQSLTNVYARRYGKNKCKEAILRDTVQKAWVPRIEALAIAHLKMGREKKAIWGAGGAYTWDGPNRESMSVGLFHQLNKGNTYEFNIGQFGVADLEQVIADRFKDRVTPHGSIDFQIEIGVGHAMYAHLKAELGEKFRGFNTTIASTEIISGPNKGKSLDPIEIDSWRMTNGYGRIKMKVLPGLDPTDAHEKINPMIPSSVTGSSTRLSSWMIVIEDITNSTEGNILELVDENDHEMQMRIKTGKLNYMGAPTFSGGAFGGGAFKQSYDIPGYKVIYTQKDKAYFVKDITKSLLIKPINPLTGRAIWSDYWKD